MTKAETKPFWMSDEDWEKRYPQMPQANIAEQVVDGVPDLNEVEKGEVVGAYTFKDGLLIYHFYKKDRKTIFDQAHAEMDRIATEVEDPKEREAQQRTAAEGANTALAESPWWDNFEEELKAVFGEVFKYQEAKITFYREVDSWSVMLQEPSGVVTPSKQQLEKPFSMLALRLGAN